MFTNWKQKDFNYEAVRKHVELAALLDINDKELDLLNAIINMCAHWKSTARKVLNSRPLTRLEHQVIMKPSATEDDNS